MPPRHGEKLAVSAGCSWVASGRDRRLRDRMIVVLFVVTCPAVQLQCLRNAVICGFRSLAITALRRCGARANIRHQARRATVRHRLNGYLA